MKKVKLFRSGLVLALILILGIGGNAKALAQLPTYLPIVVKNPNETPDCTPPPDWSQTVLLKNSTITWFFRIEEPVMDVTLVFFYYQDYDKLGCPLDCSTGQCETDESGMGNSPLGEFFVSDGKEGANRGVKKLEGRLTKGTYLVMFKAVSGSINVGLNISTDPVPAHTTGNVEIRDIFFDGSGSSESDEYVEIENDDFFPIQLLNWTLSDEANHVFTFPSYVIQPDQVCRIYTNEDHPEWCSFNYGSGSAIWNNLGDTAYLRDANGTLIDDYSY